MLYYSLEPVTAFFILIVTIFIEPASLVDMSENVHFENPANLKEAQALLTFKPLSLKRGVIGEPKSIAVYVRDYKKRELPKHERTLELYYEGMVFTQSACGEREARRQALEVPYGAEPQNKIIGGHEARAYPLGPEPAEDDIDPRSPAVVSWYDRDLFLLLASSELSVDRLLTIAQSLYKK